MELPFTRRLLAARVLLGLALLLTVLAVFLPFDSNAPPFDDPSYSTWPSLRNLHGWWEAVCMLFLFFWFGTGGVMRVDALSIFVFLTSLLLQLSSFWLVRFYHQSRLLCWFARILALVCVGPIAYVLVFERVGDVGLGINSWNTASFILLIGLFLIPHRRREAEAAPRSV